jgi:hypothetical protein
MAHIVPTYTYDERTVLVTWSGLTAADTTEYASMPSYPDGTVSFDGTFAGATARLEASNAPDANAWHIAQDPAGTQIASGTPTILMIGTAPLAWRPVVIGGDGTTAVTVRLFATGWRR